MQKASPHPTLNRQLERRKKICRRKSRCKTFERPVMPLQSPSYCNGSTKWLQLPRLGMPSRQQSTDQSLTGK
uniref:Uncharacterized protein n=1 Tax=Physcomitrium patens TaxID=3218 RepID=A0A2K1JM67_PHYPA|nr:hypothetical protein PHYPA_017463 [Physcomitrium patens]